MTQKTNVTFIAAGGCGINNLAQLIKQVAAKNKEDLNRMQFAAIDTSDANFSVLEEFKELVTIYKVKGGAANIDEGSGGDPAAYSSAIRDQMPDIYNAIKPTTNIVLLCSASSGSGRSIIGHMASYITNEEKVKKPHIFAIGMVISTASLREITAARNAIGALNKLGERINLPIPYYREINTNGWEAADNGICHFCLVMASVFDDQRNLDAADKRAWLHGGHMDGGVYQILPVIDSAKYTDLIDPVSVITLATDVGQPTTLPKTPMWQKVGFGSQEKLASIIDIKKAGGVLHMVLCGTGAVQEDYDKLAADEANVNSSIRTNKKGEGRMKGTGDIDY